MLQVYLYDGSTIEVSREEAREVLPYRYVFSSHLLRSPVEGLFCYRGKVIPVLGPLPEKEADSSDPAKTTFLLLLKDYAQVIRGLPTFKEDEVSHSLPSNGGSHVRPVDDESSALLNELDELLKSA